MLRGAGSCALCRLWPQWHSSKAEANLALGSGRQRDHGWRAPGRERGQDLDGAWADVSLAHDEQAPA